MCIRDRIDAIVGFTEQDSKIAGYAHEQGKGCIVAINKWDALEKDTHTMNEFTKKLKNDFSFMSYVPFIFISAKTGQRVQDLFALIQNVASQNSMRVSTGMLNDLLAYCTARVQPPSDKGKRDVYKRQVYRGYSRKILCFNGSIQRKSFNGTKCG